MIQGRKYVALVFVFVFLGVLVWAVYQGFAGAHRFERVVGWPLIPIGLTALILVWAAYDLMFATSYLRLHIPTGQLEIRRKSANRDFRYTGPAQGHVRFEVRESRRGRATYHVVYLLAEDAAHCAPYQVGSARSRDDAESLMKDWELRLRL